MLPVYVKTLKSKSVKYKWHRWITIWKKKEIKIVLYLPNYNEFKQYDDG